MGRYTDILDKNLKGNRSDLYDVVAQDWNEAVAKAFKNKDLSTIPTDFVSYASERLNIPKKTVSTQIDGLKRYGNFKTDFTKIRPLRQQLAKELLTEANQGLRYVQYNEIAKRLGPKYTQATLKTLIKRIDSLPDLDSYQTKVNKAFKNIFIDADPTLIRAEDFFDPANKILDVVGTGTVVKEDRIRERTDTIYKALKNNPEYKALGYDKVFNRLRSKDFQKVVKNSVRPWNLEDVFYAADTNLNLRNPKSIDERAINFAIRSKVRGNPNMEIFSREGDRLVKINPKTAEINDYYDIVFRMDGKNYGLVGDIPGVIDLKKEGRRLPEFENFYKVAAAKDELAQRTKFPDGSDIINPRTGKPSTFEELMKDAYYYARGKKRGYAMAFPYDIDHLDIKNDPFGSKNPQNLRIIPKRVNVSVGQMVNPEKVTKTGYYFEKDLPIDQQINNMMSREQKLAQDILKFDDQGQHIGRRLDTAARAAEKQILTRGIPDTPKIPIDATRTEFKKIIAKLSPNPTCAVRLKKSEGGGVSGLDECFQQGMQAIKEGNVKKPHQVQSAKQLMNAGKRIGASTFARRLLDLGILGEVAFLAGDVGIRQAMGRPFSEAFKAATFREGQADKERIIRSGGSPEVIKARELDEKLKSVEQEIKSAESLGDYYSSTDIDALKQRRQNILKELAPFQKYLSLTSPQTISTNIREQNIIDADAAKSPFTKLRLRDSLYGIPNIADYGETDPGVMEVRPKKRSVLPSSEEAILENLKFNLGDPTADREAKEFYDAGYEIFPDDFTSYKMQLEAQSPGREEQMYGFNPDKGLEIPTLLPKGTYIPSPRQRREQEELMEEMGRLGAASGGLMNLTRTVAPQSGPNSKGLESLRKYATKRY